MHVVRAQEAVEPDASFSVVSYEELARRIEDEDTSMVLLNVLPRAAFESGRIPSSVNLPLAEAAERAGEVLPARDQETVVYCASADCSLAAQGVALLRGLGYTRVREYPGGMAEWTERGGRVEHAVVAVPKPAARPDRRLDRLRRVLARLSPPVVFTWATNQSLRALFGIWLGMSALFALFYWGRGAAGLLSDGAPLAPGLEGLHTAFWFSVATAMTSDLGGVSAVGWNAARRARRDGDGAGALQLPALEAAGEPAGEGARRGVPADPREPPRPVAHEPPPRPVRAVGDRGRLLQPYGAAAAAADADRERGHDLRRRDAGGAGPRAWPPRGGGRGRSGNPFRLRGHGARGSSPTSSPACRPGSRAQALCGGACGASRSSEPTSAAPAPGSRRPRPSGCGWTASTGSAALSATSRGLAIPRPGSSSPGPMAAFTGSPTIWASGRWSSSGFPRPSPVAERPNCGRSVRASPSWTRWASPASRPASTSPR